MHCTVIEIRGDYALIRREESGTESEVAMALLPEGIDCGDRLLFENFEYTKL